MDNIAQYGKILNAAVKKDKVIYVGKNHSECLQQRPAGELRSAEQGFITESGDFVDRKLGLQIAQFYDQIKHKHPPYDELMSEDMLNV